MTARELAWFVTGFLFGAIAYDPDVVRFAHQLGTDTRHLLGLPPIDTTPHKEPTDE